MNLANKITMMRLLLIPVFMVAFLNMEASSYVPAFIFLLASLTDFADGFVARKYNMVTTFGKFMDPLMDKLLTMSAFILLCEAGKLAGWLVVLIIVRELTITAFRTLAVANNVILAASIWGKYKTAFQLLTIIVLLLEDGLLSALKGGMLAKSLIVITVFLTVFSGLDYIVKNRNVLDLDNI